MITENYEAYADGGTQKDFRISVVGEETVIENSNMLTESIKLDEALCSDENLRFGCCEASQFTVQVANVFDNFEGKNLAVTVTMDEETTKYGTFKVLSDKPTADRVWRTITAYDAMRDIINADVLKWYNALTFPMTIRAFRDSFFNHLGITQKAVTLINDSFEVKGGFSATGTLSGKTIVSSICEFNGVFGHINRDGNFEYVSLDSASNFICPPYQNNSVTYEDYVTEAITKVTMRGSADDIGTSVGVDGNEYIIQNNPLIYGTEGTQTLITAITNLLNKISQVTFRPYSLSKTIGNPCVELGDSITISTRYQTINSYVIKRVLSGIQALRDSYSATGNKVYPKQVNSIQEEINRTQGKMNELSKTVDETVSTVTRVEQIAEDAQETANNANSTAVTAQSQVTQMADQIVLKVDNNGNVVKVALSSDASTGSNVLIKGDNIQLDGNVTITSGFVLNVGTIQSQNYAEDSHGYATQGMKIKLSDGTLNTPAFRIDTDGAYIVDTLFIAEKQYVDGVFNGQVTKIPILSAKSLTYTQLYSGYEGLILSYGEPYILENFEGGGGTRQTWIYGGFIDFCRQEVGVSTTTYNTAMTITIPRSNNTTKTNRDNNSQVNIFGTLAVSNLTANRILVSDADKNIVSSSYEFDINTNNTSDTWLLVMNGSKIQHRLSTDLSVNHATTAGTANNNILKNGDNGSAAIYWKEYGYGDKFQIQPQFSGADDANYLAFRGAVGGAGTSPSLYDLARLTGKSGNLWIKGLMNTDSNNGYVVASRVKLTDLGTASFVACANNGVFVRRYDNNNTAQQINASAFNTASSKLIKDNIKPISDEEAKKLLELNVVNYDYKYLIEGKDKTGMIAEEVIEILPNYVHIPENYSEEATKEKLENGEFVDTMSLDYSDFVPPLIKLVQIQQKQIEELKQSNNFYQNIILQMQAEIEQIKQKTEE